MSDVFLAAKGLHKNYRSGIKDVRAINGLSLGLERGRSVGIIGPSGAGKSTLLHLLGGLDSPTAGEVTLDGVNIYKLPDSERSRIRNRRVGFVFQFYHLLPEFTALENVMLPAMMRKTGTKSCEGDCPRFFRKAEQLLETVGLKDRMNHRPGELSGGESQRVAIARALMNSPEILLCDEPTGNLDSKTSESIYKLLFDLKAATGMTLVIVTHDERISDRTDETIRIKDGKLIK